MITINKIKMFINSIFGNMIIFFILIIFINVFVIGIVSYKVSERTVLLQADDYNEKTLDYIEANLTMLFDQMVSVVNMYNMNTEIERMTKKQYDDDYDRLTTVRDLEEKLSYSLSTYDWLKQNITIIGKNKSRFIGGLKTIVTAENFDTFTFSKEIRKSPDKIHWFGPEIDIYDNHSNMITAIKPLENSTLGGYYGTMILGNNEETLFNLYKNKVEDGKNIIFIADKKGNIISHNRRDMIGTKIDVDKYINSEDKFITYNNENFVTAFRQLMPTGWYLVQMTSLESINNFTTILKESIVITIILSSLFAIVSTTMISKKISAPIVHLSHKISRQHGNKVNNDDGMNSSIKEVLMIDQEYQFVINKLESTIDQLMEEQKEKRKLELEALQMQINPHFLYNTLNSIRMLTWTKKYENIDPAVTALVDLLQQTLNNRDELITLEAEMENTKNYILIQNIRKEGQISTEYIIDDTILHCRVPKLILQPLVENAIFHGIDKIHSYGKIVMTANQEGDDIVITIQDNGPGITESKIKELLDGDDTDKKRKFTGIGVKNVDNRLKLYFGEKYGLDIKSEINRGTTVNIVLPYIPHHSE